MHEFEELDTLDDVSQGDVIEWVGEHRVAPWHTHGIVVTADCDLLWNKHQGYISYVPAWSTEDFVWYHWRLLVLQKPCDDAFAKLATRLSTWRAKANGGSEISAEAVRAWLRRAGPDGLMDELGVTNKGERNTLTAVIDPAVLLDTALHATDVDFSVFAKAYAAARSKQYKPEWFSGELAKMIEGLPGDIFHLPSMPGDENGDLFLMLRHIRQIRGEELTSRPDDVRTGAAKAKRIARVTAPYRYAITQNLGKIFSDIGLPEAYEKRRGTSAERFCKARITT
ncbi:hypothetical protein ACA106_06855 [Agrobacterium pusense]|uniref:Uncharacterized protein n=1 Tax=Agrobacterium pusense TaxID=648995 RepID=U4Q354_9HYPH|nr:hypothetical protein [Agrobacterium pusense]CDI11772.1 protein of unknown function [Agrobacterium pusense]